MVLLVEVIHRNADSVERSCHFAYVLHHNADSVEKSFSAYTYIASLFLCVFKAQVQKYVFR